MKTVNKSPGLSQPQTKPQFNAVDRGSADRQHGRALPAIVVFIVICSAALVTVAFVFGTVVSVGSVGLRKIAFGPRQGLLDTALRPGFHWTIPGYSTIYEIPQTVRVLHFDRELSSTTGSYGSLDVPTIDGTTVDVDVSLLYRFYPHSGQDGSLRHGGPSDLINKVGATEVQWTKYLGQVADNEIKRSLGALSTVEFYEPKAREDRVAVAERNLQETLAPLGIHIESVLLRRYTYREEIDQAIFKKNLQELESAFNKVAGDFAEARRDVNKVEADGDVAIQNLDKQGVSEADKIRSEGDLYRRQKIAEGELLVAQARAEVDKQRNDVLSKAGSDVYVALQLTKILTTLKGGVVANVDPFDLDSWLKKLIGPDIKARLDQQEGGNDK